LVRKELTEHLEEIDNRNKNYESPYICSTHDFYDANILMAEAFEFYYKREPDVNGSEDVAVWNSAWSEAKKVGFNNEWPR